jgi:hypothetical protein
MKKDTTFLTIDLDCTDRGKQQWPPSPIPILLLSIPMATYPLWVLILTKYRDESPPLPKFFMIPLNLAAAWVLDILPNIVIQIFFWYIIVCLMYLGFWHLGILKGNEMHQSYH